MSNPLFIGIDGGTQSTKVGIFSSSGELLAKAQCPLQPIVQNKHGEAYHPDEDLWASLVKATKAALQGFAGKPEDIKGVGLCSIRCCRVIIDSHGQLVEPVISWMDERLAHAYESTDVNDALVTSTTGYLGLRLTGEKTDSAANYEGAWPLDKATWDWSNDKRVINECGLLPDQLSTLKMPGQAHGMLTPSAADQLNLPEGIPVICTANDKAVEALGTGLHSSKAALLSLGTYICGMQNSDQMIEGAKTYYSNLACVPYQYLSESAGVREGMRLMVWLKNFFGIESDQQLDELAALSPTGANGLATLPDWLAPPAYSHRKGVTLGWQAKHTRADFIRSVYEGLVLTMHNNFCAMWNELGDEPPEILLSGGGAQSTVLAQMVADVFNKRCGVPRDPNTVALGAAMCAAANADESSILDSAAKMKATINWRQPIQENVDAYKEIQARFYTHYQEDMVHALKRFQALPTILEI